MGVHGPDSRLEVLDAVLLAQALVGVWLASSHQVWAQIFFVILELCERPEYVATLREEIDKAKGKRVSA